MSKAAISVAAFREKFPDVAKAWDIYASCRLNAENCEELAKIAKANMRGAESDLIDLMLDREVSGVPDESGSYASTARDWSIACNAENKAEVEDFLQRIYGDAEVFKTFILDKFAIQAKLRKDCEDEDHELVEAELPEFFNLNTRPKLRVKGWIKKQAEEES